MKELFVRHFTKNLKSPYDGINWVMRDSVVRDKDGSVIRRIKDVEVPDFWSQTAVDMLAQKYFRKAGVPNKLVKKEVGETCPPWLCPRAPSEDATFGSETSLTQVIDRLAGHWTYSAWINGYFDSDKSGGVDRKSLNEARLFYDEISYMLVHQMAAPNSPQWFNTGLWWAYGIKGENSGTFVAEQSEDGRWHTEEVEESYSRPQVHACFIQEVQDDLVSERGIFGLWTREARVFKFGGGSGSNFSNIRGKGEPLSGGGTSSGLMSWLKIGDRAAGAIKSGGTTRRAAKIVVVDDDHPDLLQFVRWKREEEQKVAAMVCGYDNLDIHMRSIIEHGAIAIKQAKQAKVPENYIRKAIDMRNNGMSWTMPVLDTDYEGEAYVTVSGQNANNSVSVSNRFMEAVERDDWWGLVNRLDKRAGRTDVFREKLKARDVFREINEASWFSADPGLIFRDTMNAWNTCPNDGEIVSTNPCGEYCFLNDTGCNLASINLLKFLSQDGKFDHAGFSAAVRLWTIILDVTVDMASYPSAGIAVGSKKYRTLGLGYANLGALLMCNAMPYSSHEGRMLASSVTSLMTAKAYETSALLAQKLGTFPRFDANRQDVLKVIKAHGMCSGAYPLDRSETNWPASYTPMGIYPTVDFAGEVVQSWIDAYEAACEHGVRNAQVTLIAPTGTISLLMDCDTTGVEPDFALVKYKKLAGGGYVKIVNQSVTRALRVLGYKQYEIDAIKVYMLGSSSHAESALAGSPHGFEQACKDRGLWYEIEAAASESMDMRHLIKDWTEWGFTSSQWNDINTYVCGAMTIEGAPCLDPAHLEVFDCANRCGRTGTRYIDPMGHLNMLAGLTPLLSGAISKTVNFPEHATVDDFHLVHMQSWKLGVKDVSCYRDSCKLNQPLSSSFSFEQTDSDADRILKVVESVGRGRRDTLPDRRKGYTQKVRIDSHKIYLRTGEYSDGTLGEIFVDMAKQGSQLRSWASAFAMAVSIGLQHGVPLERFVESFVFTKFEPNGMVAGHERIKACTSVIDMIFRDLGITYLNRTDLAHVNPGEVGDEGVMPVEASGMLAEDTKSSRSESVSLQVTSSLEVAVARMKGYEGEACGQCHQMTLVRNGVCLKCDTCGSTTGCS